MKKFKGNRKGYFILTIITLISTLHKLSAKESQSSYHQSAFDVDYHKTSPPVARF